MPTILTECPAWKALEAHYQSIRGVHLRSLFADDPRRAERFTLEAAGTREPVRMGGERRDREISHRSYDAQH